MIVQNMHCTCSIDDDLFPLCVYIHVLVGQFKFQVTSSPLVRSNSLTTPTSPRTALAEAQEFIEPAEEIDLSDPGGRTALHLAIVHRHPKVVDILIQHKGKWEKVKCIPHDRFAYMYGSNFRCMHVDMYFKAIILLCCSTVLCVSI